MVIMANKWWNWVSNPGLNDLSTCALCSLLPLSHVPPQWRKKPNWWDSNCYRLTSNHLWALLPIALSNISMGGRHKSSKSNSSQLPLQVEVPNRFLEYYQLSIAKGNEDLLNALSWKWYRDFHSQLMGQNLWHHP